jgi:hypothetical protein
MMEVDHDDYLATASGGDDGAELTRAFRDYRTVRVVGTLYIRTPIDCSVGDRRLICDSMQYIVQDGPGPMFVMGPYCETYGLSWIGVPDKFDGSLILCPPDTGRQRIGHGHYMRSRGPCIDMSGHAAGNYSTVADSLIQRADLSPAIVLPTEEQGTIGVRRIMNCSGAGGVLLDLANSNVTKMTECDTAGVIFGEGSRYATLIDNRLAGRRYDVRGTNHRFALNTSSAEIHFTGSGGGHVYTQDNYDAGRALDPGATNNVVERHPSCPATVDNSGNATNRIAA